MDGWEEDDDVFVDENFDDIINEPITKEPTINDPPTANHNMSVCPPFGADENQMQDGWGDHDLEKDDANEGALSRAAGAFGAALLASIDEVDGDAALRQQQQQQQQEEGFGFGGGFVMKGLRGFIDAATAPQKEDGWEDDNDLDLETDGWSENEADINEVLDEADIVQSKNQVVDQSEMQNEPLNNFAEDVLGEKVNDAQQIGDSEPTDPVSDSIKDFVAKTESTLNTAFTDASKTPTRTPRNQFAPTSEQVDMVEVDKTHPVVSKSLSDFVDNLDAEINELKGSIKEPTENAYNFQDNENNSPDLLEEGSHNMDSLCITATDEGPGGTVHSKNIQPQEYTLPRDSDLTLDDGIPSETLEDTPIDEAPSVVNSEHDSNQDILSSNNGNLTSTPTVPAEYACNYEQSELKCNCLELILPLPQNSNGSFSEESGFGTKTLPDGTTVLVNYEKLLLNEATKRILLQRSVDTYERTMEKMQTKYHSMTKASEELENSRQNIQSQLDQEKSENAKLKELVAQLKEQNEQMKTDSSLSEAQEELSEVAMEKTRLEKQAEELQEQLRHYQEQITVTIEDRDNLAHSLEKAKTEQFRLEELVQLVQSDLSEARQTCSLFQSENDALQEELNTKSVENAVLDIPAVSAALNDKISSLENKLKTKSSDCDVLNEQISDMLSDQATRQSEIERLKQENHDMSYEISEMRRLVTSLENEKESLHTAQADSQARITELTAMVGSMDNTSREIDKLVAENASLTYELGIKSTENDKHIAAMNALQAKLDMANASLSSNDQNTNNNIVDNEIETMKPTESREEELQSQFDEFRQHHTNTMDYMEEQLSGLMQEKSLLLDQLEECRNEMDRMHQEKLNLEDTLKTAQDTSRVQELENELMQFRVMMDERQADMQKYEEIRTDFDRVQIEHGNVLARNRALEQDNKSLEFQLNEVSTKSNQLAADHRALEQDKHALEFQLNEAVSKHKKLEADILSLQEQMEEQERNALDAISQRESKDISSSNGDSVETNELLQHEIKTLTGQLGDLTTQLDSMQTSHDSISADRDQLITRVAELEKELKDERMSELRDEVTSLHKEREQLDLDNEELLVQLGLMQQSKLEYEQEVENELTRLRGQVATLQDNIVYLQRQLDEAKGNNAPLSQNELDALVEKLHKENAELQRNITKLSSEKGSLEDDILKLTDTVNALEQQQGSKQTPDDAQVHQLKSKIAELEAKLSSLEQETSEMQQLKTQIHDLERRLSEKEHDIMISTQEALEQNDVDHTSQVEENSSIDSKPTNDVHEEESKEHDYDDDSLQDLFADEIESDDYLRQQIVILAQALERSELQRAAVLDRLTRERKGNADSLRQLGESVKRFYSTVRSSGST